MALLFLKNCCLHESKGIRLFTERLRKETCNFALWGGRSPSNPALQDSRLVEEKPAERKWVEKEAENCLDLNKSPWTCQICRSQIKRWGAEPEGLAWKATWRRKVNGEKKLLAREGEGNKTRTDTATNVVQFWSRQESVNCFSQKNHRYKIVAQILFAEVQLFQSFSFLSQWSLFA